MKRSGEPASAGQVHRQGDGDHLLPVRWLVRGRLRPLSSKGCVLLHFACWAQDHGFDPVDIYARARPRVPPLRPDQLLFFKPWTQIRRPLSLDLLCGDLCAVGEDALVRVLLDVTTGRWHPPAAFTHWVVTKSGVMAGEARDLDPADHPDQFGQHFCFVRLFGMPDMAEWGYAEAANLRPKAGFA
jgi:hypothetical protein